MSLSFAISTILAESSVLTSSWEHRKIQKLLLCMRYNLVSSVFLLLTLEMSGKCLIQEYNFPKSIFAISATKKEEKLRLLILINIEMEILLSSNMLRGWKMSIMMQDLFMLLTKPLSLFKIPEILELILKVEFVKKSILSRNWNFFLLKIS